MHLYRDLKQFAKYPYDILIVGGGFLGANIARDAAMRGLRVALVEAQDFCQSTYATPSKMAQGGLRYLKSLDYSLVRETIGERMVWRQLAPHLVETVPFLMPVYGEDRKEFNRIRAGFTLFDFLMLDRRLGHAREPLSASHNTVSAEALLRKVSGLKERNLVGGFSFVDCQAHSPERLGLEVLLSAVEHGAQIINYCRATEIVKSSTEAQGAVMEDQITGMIATVKASLIINATGPSAEFLVKAAVGQNSKLRIKKSKSIQLITRSLNLDQALAIPCDDVGNYIFVVPWRGHSIVGTSEYRFCRKEPSLEVQKGEIERLIAQINDSFPGAFLSSDDVVQAFSSIRPWLDHGQVTEKSNVNEPNSERSGADDPVLSATDIPQSVIFDHKKDGLSGFITALGGKWTSTRLVSDRIVTLCLRKLKKAKRPSRTHKQPLYGGRMDDFDRYLEVALERHTELPKDIVEHLVRTYGSHYRRVLTFVKGNVRRLSPHLPDIEAQVRYGVHHELAVQVDDFVCRRTNMGTLYHPGKEVVVRVAEIMAEELGWLERETREQIDLTLTKLDSKFVAGAGDHMAA